MIKKLLNPLIFFIPLIFGFGADTGDSWQVALCNIGLIGSSDMIHCNKLQDQISFESGNNVSIEIFNSTKVVKISATSGNGPNENYCNDGDWFNAYNETTNNFDCATVPTSDVGENNTASNVGVGFGLFKQKNGVNLEFLNIFCAGDLLCTSNSTDLRISATIPTGSIYENNTMSSPTHANSLVLAKSGVDLPIKGIACRGSAICLTNDTDVTIDVSSSGEANTQSSPTHANTLVLSKSGVDLPIKGIACTGLINCSNNSTDITITNSSIKNRLLDGSNHTDTVSSSASRGSIIYGDSSNLWNELPVGGSNTYLSSDGTDISWQTISGGLNTITGNITSTSTSIYTQIALIPLTVNSGNTISGTIIGDSDVAGNALQLMGNLTGAGKFTSSGSCNWWTPTTATGTPTFDMISVMSNADTGETAWLHVNATSITFDCGIQVGASATNLLISFQNEASGTTRVISGWYTKVP